MIITNIQKEAWDLKNTFTISRGSKTAAEVVVITIEEDGVSAMGECVPYARYDETCEKVIQQLQHLNEFLKTNTLRLDNININEYLPAGSARNAVDCAMWNLKSKKQNKPVYELLNLPETKPYETAFTISIDTPDAMAKKAKTATNHKILKVKLGKNVDNDLAILKAINKARPDAKLIVDVNEGWSFIHLNNMLREMVKLNVKLVEQPLPANDDDKLIGFESPIPICADESSHTSKGLRELKAKYGAINIKLDKTGGLTEAVKMAHEAKKIGFEIVIGCMVCTSLSVKSAEILTPIANFIDLDGPLLLKKDRIIK